jgi:hypothetical protein
MTKYSYTNDRQSLYGGLSGDSLWLINTIINYLMNRFKVTVNSI